MKTHLRALLVSVPILPLVMLAQAAELDRSTVSHPPSVFAAAADLSREATCKAGDNPLTPYYSWFGTGGVVLDVIGDTVQSGIFRIRGIPPGASIVWACMYEACWWEASPNIAASVTFAGTTLPSVLPFDYDSTGIGGYVLCAYCWDVTSQVYGNGDYEYSVSQLLGTWGEALVVVYSEVSEPVRKVLVNHGAEALEHASSTTAFADLEADSATLLIFTQADNSGGPGEAVYFNDAVVAGPGDIFHGNRGVAASLLELGVECTTGTNTVTCVTQADYFGWHLAVLQTYGLAVKVTGGGWFVGSRVGPGFKKTFGFNVHSESGVCRGQLQFNDHSLGMKVHGDSLHSLTVSGDTAAFFRGSCHVNKNKGYTFECTVEDRGEPGRRVDSFHLGVFDADGYLYYSEGGLLGGGNIQIHVDSDREATVPRWVSDSQPGSPLAPIPSTQHDVRNDHKTHTYLRNSPNPFHHSTIICYSLPQASRVSLAIYDIAGRMVETLVNETKQPGTHQVRWNSKNNPSGVYFYSLRARPEQSGERVEPQSRRAGEFMETRKMVVLN